MSSYLHFFVKSKNNEFVPIGCYCRSSEIYQAFNENYHLPYEKITPLTIHTLSEINDRLKIEIENEKDSIARENEIFTTKLNCVKHWDKNIEETDEYLNELVTNHYSYIDEMKDIIDENKAMINYLTFLMDMIETIRWEDDYNESEFIYAGIDCGDNVTMEDIV